MGEVEREGMELGLSEDASEKWKESLVHDWMSLIRWLFKSGIALMPGMWTAVID